VQPRDISWRPWGSFSGRQDSGTDSGRKLGGLGYHSGVVDPPAANPRSRQRKELARPSSTAEDDTCRCASMSWECSRWSPCY
jgi:hypothetical protein